MCVCEREIERERGEGEKSEIISFKLKFSNPRNLKCVCGREREKERGCGRENKTTCV